MRASSLVGIFASIMEDKACFRKRESAHYVNGGVLSKIHDACCHMIPIGNQTFLPFNEVHESILRDYDRYCLVQGVAEAVDRPMPCTEAARVAVTPRALRESRQNWREARLSQILRVKGKLFDHDLVSRSLKVPRIRMPHVYSSQFQLSR